MDFDWLELTEVREIIRSLLIFSFAFYLNELILRGLKRFRRPIVVESKWNDVKIIPKHKFSDKWVNLIITDGKRSEVVASCMLKHNEQGQVVLDYEGSEVTHWQYMPSPPEE